MQRAASESGERRGLAGRVMKRCCAGGGGSTCGGGTIARCGRRGWDYASGGREISMGNCYSTTARKHKHKNQPFT